MSPTRAQTRIIKHSFASLLQGGRLDSVQDDDHELHLVVQGLEVVTSKVFERERKLFERITGRHIPLKLSFSKVTQLNRADFFNTLEQIPVEDPSRIIAQMHSWIMPAMDDIFHIFNLRAPVSANMNFFASGETHQQATSSKAFTFDRDSSPAPPMPEGVVPQPRDLHDNYGGDPASGQTIRTVP